MDDENLIKTLHVDNDKVNFNYKRILYEIIF